MKYIIYIIFILLLLAFNTELASMLIGTPFRINLLLFPAVFAALEKKDRDFLFLAILGGLFLDSYNAAPFGSFTVSFLLAASILNWAVKNFWIYEPNLKLLVLSVLFSFFAIEILVRLLAIFLPTREFVVGFSVFSNFFPAVLYASLLHLVLAFPVYGLWQLVRRILESMETKRIILK